MPLTVVIPTLNEELFIGGAVRSAFAGGAAEVLVCDGGSTDATAGIARKEGAKVLAGDAMRARQMNLGANAASNDALLFLHADTTLPGGAASAVCGALDRGAVFGGFRLAFMERDPRLRIAESMINLRTWLTRCPWGDQAQFVRRERFLECGGFREIPIMEDYDLAARMKQRGGIAILPLTVRTSGRRFLERGVLRTAATNWRIIVAWRFGADPDELARLYRDR